jgi:hypothetical protein
MKNIIAQLFAKKETAGTSQPAVAETKSLLTAAEEAAVAMALYCFYQGAEESRVITIADRQTDWNSKIYGLNNLHR